MIGQLCENRKGPYSGLASVTTSQAHARGMAVEHNMIHDQFTLEIS